MSIAANLERLRNDIADACAHAHRTPDSVALMAVSKTHPAQAIREAHAAGQRLFGENRVQEWQSKAEECGGLDGLDVHLIGPLQNNKTGKAAEIFSAIDTLDSLKTAARLNDSATALNKTLPVLIEIKLSHEDSKHGLAPAELPGLLEAFAALTHIEARGLMTVPAFTDDPELARPAFAALRRLLEDNAVRFPALTELSMGMSHDFRAAIAEGSTCVRLGTAIFGQRG